MKTATKMEDASKSKKKGKSTGNGSSTGKSAFWIVTAMVALYVAIVIGLSSL
jgi:hypothetical protein